MRGTGSGLPEVREHMRRALEAGVGNVPFGVWEKLVDTFWAVYHAEPVQASRAPWFLYLYHPIFTPAVTFAMGLLVGYLVAR